MSQLPHLLISMVRCVMQPGTRLIHSSISIYENQIISTKISARFLHLLTIHNSVFPLQFSMGYILPDGIFSTKKNLLNKGRWELTSSEWQKSRQTIPQQQNIYTSSPDINEKRFTSSQSIILIAIYAGRHPIDHNATENEKTHTHIHITKSI